MTKPARVLTIIAVILAYALLLTGGGLYLFRGDLFYRAEQALDNETASLSDYRLASVEGETLPLDQFLQDARVTDTPFLMLVNEAHPIPDGFVTTLTEYNGAKMHPSMVEAYVAMRKTVVARTDTGIYVSSDYRTAAEQAEILAESEIGVAARVGCSEHEIGLALDLYAPYCAGESFLRSSAGRVVNRICWDYGFVIRYEAGKENVTGIAYEPWHVRYVGLPHAKLMQSCELALEEYVESLTPGTWYGYEQYRILRVSQDACDVTLPNGWTSATVSPDNTGHLILTLQMGA